MWSKRAGLLLAAVLLCGAMGCASTNALVGYLDDRADDLIDVIHVDLTAGEVGAVVYGGPFMLGLDQLSGKTQGEPADTLQLGFGGQRIFEQRGYAAGLIWPSFRWNPDQQMFVGPRPKKTPSVLAVGASVGFLFGIGVHADAYELVDFVLGFFRVDIGQDDAHGVDAPPKAAVDNAEPDPGGAG